MRMSCNGCRVLRKGCSDNCSIRPCLDWIKNPDSQANATVFLAKFYGRAGLINLINAGPPHLRPAIFRSLLYEACGRIVNPVYGSVGLMWTGSWQRCQTAVEAILKGDPISPVVSADVADTKNGPPLKAYDIRHVNKEDNFSGTSNDLSLVRTRCRFKRSGKMSKPGRSRIGSGHEKEVMRSPSHESSLSHQSEAVAEVNRENGSLGSDETSYGDEPDSDTAREVDRRRADDGQIELDLTLGFVKPKELAVKGEVGSAENDAGLCKMELGLQYPAFSN